MKLKVQMRTTFHIAEESDATKGRPFSITCECGKVADTRTEMEYKHMRPRGDGLLAVRPRITEVIERPSPSQAVKDPS